MTDEPDTGSPDYAEIVLATDSPSTSRQTHLYRGHWFDALEVYWKDLHRPGPFADRDYGTSDLAGGMGRNRDSSLRRRRTSPSRRARPRPSASRSPGTRRTSANTGSRRSGTSASHRRPCGQWKNWYATEWTGAETIAAEVLSRWTELRDDTFQFRDAVYSSTLPVPVLDAAAANLSILKSPTTLRLEDGTFYGWEGCHPAAGSCEGSCTHVWNYQQALPFLYPALERSMREADYKYNMNAAGGLSFRLSLPLGTNYTTERPCADGQFGNILKLYRDWKLSGDTEWLARLWPLAKRSIEYAWSPDNPDRWDPEQTGVLWGRQHHTLDMELFGPNSWLTGFYLGALKAAAEMADALDETDDGRALQRDLRAGPGLGRSEPLQRRVLHPAGRPRRQDDPRPLHQGRDVARRPRRHRRGPLLERRAQGAQVPARRRLPDRPGAGPVACRRSMASATFSTARRS